MTSQCHQAKTTTFPERERNAQIQCGAFIIILMTTVMGLLFILRNDDPESYSWLLFAFPGFWWLIGAIILLSANDRYKLLLAEARNNNREYPDRHWPIQSGTNEPDRSRGGRGDIKPYLIDDDS